MRLVVSASRARAIRPFAYVNAGISAAAAVGNEWMRGMSVGGRRVAATRASRTMSRAHARRAATASLSLALYCGEPHSVDKHLVLHHVTCTTELDQRSSGHRLSAPRVFRYQSLRRSWNCGASALSRSVYKEVVADSSLKDWAWCNSSSIRRIRNFSRWAPRSMGRACPARCCHRLTNARLVPQ